MDKRRSRFGIRKQAGERIRWLSDPDLQAAFLAKFYLLHWSAGVERFYWYAYDNNKWGTLWDAENGLHKAGIAYREVHQWLQDATMTAPCALNHALWTCNLVRENGYRASGLVELRKRARGSKPHLGTGRVPAIPRSRWQLANGRG